MLPVHETEVIPKSLSGAPRFSEIYADLLEILHGRRVIVYNAPYDRRVWNTAVRRLGCQRSTGGRAARVGVCHAPVCEVLW